jgi:hypothetical protein
MEDERGHIKKVENALANSLQELGYKSAWLTQTYTTPSVARL